MRVLVLAALGMAALTPRAPAETTRSSRAPAAGQAGLETRDPADLFAAASPRGSFADEVRIQLAAYTDSDKGGNQFLVGYRYYFEDIRDEDEPYRLQPFLQRATYAEAAFESGPKDAGLFTVGARYMFLDTPFGAVAAAGFGKTDTDRDRSFGSVGFDFYVVDEFAVEARMEFGDCAGSYNRFQVGARLLARVVATGHTIQIYCGYRALSAEGDADTNGVAAEARYFFDKHLFAGFDFTTDTNLFSVSAGYDAEGGFVAEIEAGTEGRKDKGLEDVERRGAYFRITVGLRF